MDVGRGILAIWHDIAPESRDATLEWYDREHHFERLAVPGFRSVRRYHAVEGAPELFIRYETDTESVLSSPAYLARLDNPTPWTLRSQPTFRNNSRTVCRRDGAAGTAEGGIVVTVRLAADAGFSVADFEPLAAGLVGRPGTLSAEFWRADPGRSSIPTREKELRGAADRTVGAVVVVHGRDVASGRAIRKAAQDALAGFAPEIGVYQLSFMADNPAI